MVQLATHAPTDLGAWAFPGGFAYPPTHHVFGPNFVFPGHATYPSGEWQSNSVEDLQIFAVTAGETAITQSSDLIVRTGRLYSSSAWVDEDTFLLIGAYYPFSIQQQVFRAVLVRVQFGQASVIDELEIEPDLVAPGSGLPFWGALGGSCFAYNPYSKEIVLYSDDGVAEGGRYGDVRWRIPVGRSGFGAVAQIPSPGSSSPLELDNSQTLTVIQGLDLGGYLVSFNDGSGGIPGEQSLYRLDSATGQLSFIASIAPNTAVRLGAPSTEFMYPGYLQSGEYTLVYGVYHAGVVTPYAGDELTQDLDPTFVPGFAHRHWYDGHKLDYGSGSIPGEPRTFEQLYAEIYNAYFPTFEDFMAAIVESFGSPEGAEAAGFLTSPKPSFFFAEDEVYLYGDASTTGSGHELAMRDHDADLWYSYAVSAVDGLYHFYRWDPVELIPEVISNAFDLTRCRFS